MSAPAGWSALRRWRIPLSIALAVVLMLGVGYQALALGPDVTQVTGCLQKDGTIVSVAPGGAPLAPCNKNAEEITLSTVPIDPAGSGLTGKPIPQPGYAPTVVVRPVGTAQANGSALLSALAGIADASESKPYLLKVEPGTYDVGTASVVMKPWVDIEGSGELNTIITGSTAPSSGGVLRGANNAEVRWLTVKGTAGRGIANSSASPRMTHVTVTVTAPAGTYDSFGVVNEHSSPTMTNVTVSVSGGGSNYGVSNYFSSPTMSNVAASASGGDNSYGVYNDNSSPTMTDVIASASGKYYAIGVRNANSSSPTMTDVTASASATTQDLGNSYGVDNINSSSPTMSNVTAIGSGGKDNTGVVVTSASSPTIRNSRVVGDRAIYQVDDGSTTKVGASQLVGGVIGTVTCAGVYGGDFTFYASTCPLAGMP